MPKRSRKKASLKYSPLKITLLLVKIILIKIGSWPILLFLSSRTISVAIFRRQHKIGRPKKFRLAIRFKIAIAIFSFISFFATYTIFILTAAYQLPTPSRLTISPNPLTTEIYDRNNTLLYRLYEDKNRTLVKLPDIPQPLIQATLAIEDKNFYKHAGIDPLAILRAFYNNLQNGNLEGASTITQQLVKNSLLTPEKTYSRKLREVILAMWTELTYSKDEILQMYFNEAPYGGSLVGIAAASYTYFDKLPSELTLAESAYLAGLPASPTQFSPYGQNPKLGRLRQQEVLQKMVKDKYITQYEADQAFAQELSIKPASNNIFAPHFVFYIRDLLVQKYGPRLVSQGGLKVTTTLDLNVQTSVEKIVKDEIDKLGALNVQNGAAMVTNAETGQIIAMVGSRDYHYPNFGNFNVALALRQPGSSIKPVTYALAFEKGFSPGKIILDTPVVFRDEWGNAYSPVNYDGRFRGPVTLRQALGSSLNIPAVKLLASLGVEDMARLAAKLGISTFDNPKRFGLSLTLGSAEVKMVEMMGMYGAFAQNGLYREPTGILKVTDSEGRVLEEFKDSPKTSLAPEIAYLITNILSDDNARLLAFGPKSLLHIPGYEVGVKTGTSDQKKDNWTFGYSPKYAVGVWVGNPDNSPMNPTLTSGITGAAPVWNKIMHSLLDGTKPLAFEKPARVADIPTKDLKISGVIPKELTKVQKKDDKLIFSDQFSSYSTPSAQADTKEITTN